MAAFLDDRPLVAGVNENWDDINTYEQVQRPGSDISPITMRIIYPRFSLILHAQNARIAQY